MENKTVETFSKGERHFTSSDRYLLLEAARVAGAPVSVGAVLGLSYREATEDFSVEVLEVGLCPVVETKTIYNELRRV